LLLHVRQKELMSRMSQHSSTITVPIKERYEIVWSQDHQTTLERDAAKGCAKEAKPTKTIK